MSHFGFYWGFDTAFESVKAMIGQEGEKLISKDYRGDSYAKNPFERWREDLTISGIAYAGKYTQEETEKFTKERIAGTLLHEIYRILKNQSMDFVNHGDTSIAAIALRLRSYLMKIREFVLDIENIKKKNEKIEEKINKAINQHNLNQADIKEIHENMVKLYNYEVNLLYSRLIFHIADSPKFDANNLAMNKRHLIYLAMPYEVNEEIDGRLLGISGRSELDMMYVLPKRVIVEIKTGTPDIQFDELQVTGYALVRESQFSDQPVDIGCIMYVKFNNKISIPLINCHIFPITNKLRSTFMLKRENLIKEKMKKNEQEK